MHRFLPLLSLGLLVLSGCDKCEQEPREKPASAGRTTAAAPAQDNWKSLFDGKTLGKWKETQFGGQSAPLIENGTLIIPVGVSLSGVTYTGDDLPKMNYEIELEAQRVDGNDFFCGLTFPVDKTHASLILGGWGGSLCGISSIDNEDAARNETTKFVGFDAKRWYRVRMRVTPNRLEAFLDNEPFIDIKTEGRKVDIRADIAEACPLGLSAYQTTAAMRNIRIRALK